MTGNIDTYLLMKELESESQSDTGQQETVTSESEIDSMHH
mgnify:FL=1